MSSLIHQTVVLLMCIASMAMGLPDLCPTCGVELDNKVSQIENKEAIVEERQYIMAEKFGRALDTLQRDSNTLNGDVQRLTTENNALRDQIGSLNSMKQEYMALGKMVSDLQHRVTINLNSIRGNIVKSNSELQKEQKTQASSLEGLGNYVNENKDILDETRAKMAEFGRTVITLENKVNSVLNMTAPSGSPADIEAIKGSLVELKKTYGNLQEQQDTQFDALRNSLEDLQKEIEYKKFYPGQA